MEEKNNIHDIFRRFLKNEVSAGEIEMLFDFFNKNGNDSLKLQLEPIFKEIWDEQENVTVNTLEATKILNLIHASILDKEVKLKMLEKRKQTVKSILRYAAVFICAIGISALFFLQSKKTEKLPSDKYTELFVPNGSQSRLTLADGSSVWINSGSTFRYPSEFSEKTRKVFLKGEAFFDVATDSAKRFVVNAGKIDVAVYGTAFNIKCYEDDETIETLLLRGSVKIMEANENKELSELKPNEKAIYNKASSKIYLEKNIDETSIGSDAGWKDGQIIFTNENLDKIAIRLERKFGKNIIIRDAELRKNVYTGKFVNNESLETILKIINKASPFSYKITKKEIIIFKN